MNSPQGYHAPVLLYESIEALNIRPDGVYLDATFGGGGHSRAILDQLNSGGRLYAFDQDSDAAVNVPDDGRIRFIPQNFSHLQKFLRLHEVKEVNGILADLGVSSHQLDTGDRGFSTRFDAPLDMRMDRNGALTAADILNQYSEERLHKIFERYGEVTNAKSLAKAIVTLRQQKPFGNIKDFQTAIYNLVKGFPQKYFAKVFQALRIEVNDEMGALENLLRQSIPLLAPGGRIAVITFHSLEDRMAKNFFRFENVEGELKKDFYGRQDQKQLKVITKKPIMPSENEIKENNRSRSARLRVAEKI